MDHTQNTGSRNALGLHVPFLSFLATTRVFFLVRSSESTRLRVPASRLSKARKKPRRARRSRDGGRQRTCGCGGDVSRSFGHQHARTQRTLDDSINRNPEPCFPIDSRALASIHPCGRLTFLLPHRVPHTCVADDPNNPISQPVVDFGPSLGCLIHPSSSSTSSSTSPFPNNKYRETNAAPRAQRAAAGRTRTGGPGARVPAAGYAPQVIDCVRVPACWMMGTWSCYVRYLPFLPHAMRLRLNDLTPIPSP
jgi:hypothetical protein